MQVLSSTEASHCNRTTGLYDALKCAERGPHRCSSVMSLLTNQVAGAPGIIVPHRLTFCCQDSSGRHSKSQRRGVEGSAKCGFFPCRACNNAQLHRHSGLPLFLSQHLRTLSSNSAYNLSGTFKCYSLGHLGEAVALAGEFESARSLPHLHTWHCLPYRELLPQTQV